MTERPSSDVFCAQSARGTKGTIAFIASVSLLVVLFLFLVVVRSREPLALDQGLFACFGRWIPRGWLPYRDLFDPKPPLQLYTFALGFSLGGSIRSIWWFEAAYLALTMIVTGVGLGRRLGRWAGLLGAAFVFLGLWSPGFGGYWSRAQAEEFAALPSLVGAFLALGSLQRPRHALATGVFVGLAGLFKIPAMGLAGAWAAFWLARLGLRAGAHRVLLMVAGITLPWSAAFLWFWFHGAAVEFVGAVFPIYMQIAATLGGSWAGTIASAGLTLLREVPAFLLAGALGCALLFRKSAELATWLASMCVFAFATVVAERQLYPYHFLFAIPPLALAAAAGCVLLTEEIAIRAGHRRIAAGIALALVAVLMAWRIPAWRATYGASARLLDAHGDRAELLRPFDVPGFSPRIEEEIASYLRDNSKPGDGILIWGLAPGVYALADRRPVTRYAFHKILLTEAPLSRAMPGLASRRKELVETIKRDPPVYFILGQNDANGFEPDESRVSLMRFPQLADIIRKDYRAEKNIGNFLLFRRVQP